MGAHRTRRVAPPRGHSGSLRACGVHLNGGDDQMDVTSWVIVGVVAFMVIMILLALTGRIRRYSQPELRPLAPEAVDRFAASSNRIAFHGCPRGGGSRGRRTGSGLARRARAPAG